jgi:hypothetical protein
MRYNDDRPTINTICTHCEAHLSGKGDEIGKKIVDSAKAIGLCMIAIFMSGGGMNNHHDFKIKQEGTDEIYNVESKHTEIKSDCKKYKTPWEKSVQVLNGIGNKFIIGIIYSTIFYTKILPLVKEHYQIKAEIPDYDTWSSDAFRCGDPKTPFVKELKKKFRQKYPGKSLNGIGTDGIDWRKKFLIDVFNKINTESVKKEFLNQVNLKLSQIFKEKDFYISTSGNIEDNNFNVKWWKSIDFKNFNKVEFSIKKDIIIKLSNESRTMKGILRWGKGCGFTNIRFDAK